MQLKTKLPEFIRFDNPFLFLAAALILERNGCKLESNITVAVEGDDYYLLGHTQLVMGTYPVQSKGIHIVTFQSSDWVKYAAAPLVKNLSPFLDLIKQPRFKIGQYDATALESGLQVGCTLVSWDDVRRAAALDPEKKDEETD